jgi:glycosyl transferase family 2
MAAFHIVLSCYNGARFVAEQIESIRRQTYSEWILVVRDDGSCDGTPAIVRELARQDGRIRLLQDARGNLGPLGSFGVLLEDALEQRAAYVALADQDDVWHADKLAREMELLLAHETAAGADHPTLVHSDLAVVDAALGPIHPSYLRFQRLEHAATDPLRCLLLRNFVTGCTVVANRALLQVAVPVPPVVMHDWWLAQCAAATGSVLFVPEPLVLYRQHGANTLGSRGATQLYLDALRSPRAWWARGGRTYAGAAAQICELADRLETLPSDVRVNPGARALARRACRALHGELGPLRRCREISDLGIRPRSLVAPIFFYLRMFVGVRGYSGLATGQDGR